jgi:hypothetical protein
MAAQQNTFFNYVSQWDAVSAKTAIAEAASDMK